MKAFKRLRQQRRLSQRKLARVSRVSFRTIQLLESHGHDPQVSTLSKIFDSLGYPPRFLENHLESLWENPSESIAVVSQILVHEEEAWKLWLFNFVDAFRRSEDPGRLIAAAPDPTLSPRLVALLASTVETLCEERSVPTPWWASGVRELPHPWFVSGVENLKASALTESPVHFRKRNIFVLENFLQRR